jgi:probable HAF family extracellular repeat protein
MRPGSFGTSARTGTDNAGDWIWKIAQAIAVASGLVGSIAAQTYTITDLGTLTSLGDTDSVANAINSSGVVVGISGKFDLSFGGFISKHAFVWKPTIANATTGSMTDIGGLPGFICNDRGTMVRLDTSADGVNSSNEVVGTSPTSANSDCLSGTQHAFVFGGGVFRDLGVIPSFTASFGNGINDAGQVAGFVQDSVRIHAFFYDGSFHDLNALPGFPFGLAGAVNNAGQIIGNSEAGDLSVLHGFLHSGTGPLTAADDIGTLGGSSSSARGINDQGVVVGSASLPNRAVHGFLLRSGRMTDLGTLSPDSSGNSGALAINAANDVVGNSETSGFDIHAVLWKVGGTIVDLNTLIDPSAGWVLNSATSINAAGQIVGVGMLGGRRHAFLLTSRTGLVNFALTSTSICGMAQTTGTVTLASPAPGEGAAVTILSAHPSIADGPAIVTVQPGQTTASFPITTHQVTDNVDVTFQVLLNGQTLSATLRVKPLLSGIDFAPKEICSLGTTTATVSLACPAPADELIGLSSKGPQFAPVPGNVAVAKGQTSAIFVITGGEVPGDIPAPNPDPGNTFACNNTGLTDVCITATLDMEKKSEVLTVHPILGNLAINPAMVAGSSTATGTVSLTFNLTNRQNCVAPKGGLPVSLLSNNGDVARPSVPGITIGAGANIATFRIDTTVPTAQTCKTPLSGDGSCSVAIGAHAAGSTQTAIIKVMQPGKAVNDVSQIVSVLPGGFRFDHASGRYLQQVLIINQPTSLVSIPGPVSLVLAHPNDTDTDPDPWSLVGAIDAGSGQSLQTGTATVSPIGRPFVRLNLDRLPAPGVFNPGDALTITLSYQNPQNAAITWVPVVLSGF